MATGLTVGVADGTITSLDEFLWRCASALFYGGEIPTKESLLKDLEHGYHRHALDDAKRALAAFDAAPDEELLREEHRRAARSQREYKKALQEKEKTRARYDTMRKKVQDWTPPTREHEGLKDLALKQIDESVKWDCRDVDPECYLYSPRNVRELRAEARADLLHEVKRAEDRFEEEAASVKQRLKWIEQLEKVAKRPR